MIRPPLYDPKSSPKSNRYMSLPKVFTSEQTFWLGSRWVFGFGSNPNPNPKTQIFLDQDLNETQI